MYLCFPQNISHHFFLHILCQHFHFPFQCKLYSQVFSGPPWSEEWSKEKANKRLSHFYRSEGFVGLLAENDGINGFVLGNTEPFLDSAWFYLREMCVCPNLQGQGIGSKLLYELNCLLANKAVRNIYLATDRNIPAAKFYQSNGFSQEEKMGFYYKEV